MVRIGNPIRITGSQEQSPPIGSYPWPVLLVTTLLYVGVAVALLVAGLWFVAVPILLPALVCVLQWTANLQQRRY